MEMHSIFLNSMLYVCLTVKPSCLKASAPVELDARAVFARSSSPLKRCLATVSFRISYYFGELLNNFCFLFVYDACAARERAWFNFQAVCLDCTLVVDGWRGYIRQRLVRH